MSAHVSLMTNKVISVNIFFFFFAKDVFVICNCFLIAHLVSDDHSRVKLENSENDYINASLVMVEEAQRAYILSQVRTSNNNINFCIIIR